LSGTVTIVHDEEYGRCRVTVRSAAMTSRSRSGTSMSSSSPSLSDRESRAGAKSRCSTRPIDGSQRSSRNRARGACVRWAQWSFPFPLLHDKFEGAPDRPATGNPVAFAFSVSNNSDPARSLPGGRSRVSRHGDADRRRPGGRGCFLGLSFDQRAAACLAGCISNAVSPQVRPCEDHNCSSNDAQSY